MTLLRFAAWGPRTYPNVRALSPVCDDIFELLDVLLKTVVSLSFEEPDNILVVGVILELVLHTGPALMNWRARGLNGSGRAVLPVIREARFAARCRGVLRAASAYLHALAIDARE